MFSFAMNLATKTKTGGLIQPAEEMHLHSRADFKMLHHKFVLF